MINISVTLKELLFGNHSNKQVLAKNTFWLSLIEMASKLIMFVVTVKLVRYLGPTGFGTYNFASSYVALMMIFSDLGVSTLITRDVAKHKDKAGEYLGNALGIRLATTILILGLTALTFPFLGQTSNYLLLIVLVVFYNLAQQFFTLFAAVLSAFEKMEYMFLTRTSYYLGLLAAAMLTIQLGGKLEMLVAFYVSVAVLSVLLTLIFVERLGVRIVIKRDNKFWKEVLKESAPMFGFITCSQIYGNLDTLLIGKFFGNAQVGIYQSAYKILYAFQSINVINSATFPRISVLLHEKRHTTLNKLIRIVVGASLLGLIPLALAIGWKSELIVSLIYGKTYLLAAPILVNLIWVGVLNYFRIFATNLLVAQGKQKWVFVAVLLGLVANMGLNWWVMPKMGFAFASTSLLISEALILIAAVGFSLRKSYS